MVSSVSFIQYMSRTISEKYSSACLISWSNRKLAVYELKSSCMLYVWRLAFTLHQIFQAFVWIPVMGSTNANMWFTVRHWYPPSPSFSYALQQSISIVVPGRIHFFRVQLSISLPQFGNGTRYTTLSAVMCCLTLHCLERQLAYTSWTYFCEFPWLHPHHL